MYVPVFPAYSTVLSETLKLDSTLKNDVNLCNPNNAINNYIRFIMRHSAFVIYPARLGVPIVVIITFVSTTPVSVCFRTEVPRSVVTLSSVVF